MESLAEGEAKHSSLESPRSTRYKSNFPYFHSSSPELILNTTETDKKLKADLFVHALPLDHKICCNPVVFETTSSWVLLFLKISSFGIDDSNTGLGLCGWILVIVSLFFTIITFPVSIWMCIKIIKEYERAIIFRLGRILKGGAKGPGLFFILPCTDSFIKVDMRTISFDIPPQEILTKDSVTVNVDGVVYYRVQNATLAVANITNADSATRLLAQTTLRNVLGTKNLSQILSDREEIAHSMQATLDEATDDWGIKVERVEIKDVKLPVQLQRAMAAEAEAAREARAKVSVTYLVPCVKDHNIICSKVILNQISRNFFNLENKVKR
uniref:Stomatin n=1 Tax=Apteryx owenii TaxID=8824 RepID=A0A8B9S4R9_APTOW